MKQQKLIGYTPNYPRKALRGAALTTAALMAMGGLTGCRQLKLPELTTEGMVAVPEPTEEVLVLDGEVAIPEPGEEELVTEGEEMIEPVDEQLIEEITTTGMVYVPEDK